MTEQTDKKPDAFKAVLDAAKTEQGRPELAHQSLGRPLTDHETAFAAALMGIYASGAALPEAVVEALAERGVIAPSSGKAEWSVEGLTAELAALNADLDAAYLDNGFGA